MEKLEGGALSAPQAGLKENPSLGESLRVPHDELELLRPLRLFHKALGLRAGVRGYPDPEFMLHLIEGSGHLEPLRAQFGAEFKNFENFVRRKHATSPRTWAAIVKAAGADQETSEILATLAHGNMDGPLIPMYTLFAQGVEGVFLRTYRSATIGVCICDCCGADKLDTARIWWPAQQVSSHPDAYRFVDRVLEALVGALTAVQFLSQFQILDYMDATVLEKLADPQTHPIGNWMTMLREAKGVQKDWQLLPTEDEARFRKWRCGQGLLPLHKAHVMTLFGRLVPPRPLLLSLHAARMLALAIDVVQATATSGPPSRALAQKVVAARLTQLLAHLRIRQAEKRRKETATTSTGA